jgi:sec-independent protein translocase protein TatC
MSVAQQETAPPEPGRDEGKNLTILEHLQELRERLMVAGGALIVAMVASFSLAAAGVILALILLFRAAAIPKASRRLMGVAVVLAIGGLAAYSYTFIPSVWEAAATTEVLEWLKKPAASRVENFDLVFTDPLEFWGTFFRVSLMVGLALAMPVIVWQILAFVGPGLTRNEKRWAYPIVLGASGMFVCGCAFAYYVEMPPALNFLLNPPGDIARPLISVQKYIGFATKLMVVTGFVFETPWLIIGLAKVGIVTSRKLLGWWRFAIVGAFIISAIVTPSIDPITQTLVAAPMIVLYFVGIVGARLVESTPLIPRTS